MQSTITYHFFRFRLAAALLGLCLLLPGCSDYQHPGFEPGIADNRPAEQLDHFLKTDSLIAGLDQLPNARTQLDSLLLWADLLKNYNQDAALEYANEANRIATERGWRLSRAISMYYRAMIKEKKQRLGERIEDAIVDAKMSARLLENAGREDWEIRTSNLLGGVYYKKSEFDSTKFYLNQALRIIEQARLPDSQKLKFKGEVYNDLGNVYYTESDSTWDQALAYYDRSLNIYQQVNNQAAEARVRYNLGSLYIQQGEYIKAEKEFNQCEIYATKAQDYDILIDAYRKLGFLKFKQYRQTGEEQQFQSAMDIFRRCLSYEQENLHDTFILMGRACYERTRNKPYNWVYADSAIVYYKLAMEEAREEGAIDIMKDMVKRIATLCSWRFAQFGKDCTDLLELSYESFLNNNYAAIVDTVAVSLQAANYRIQKFERKEQEAANQLRVRNTWLISGVGLIIAGLIFLIILQWQKQKRLQARMEALRAQINPHFISNSLNAIENLVNQDKREAAAKYLIHFSRLSRQILNSSRAPTASLAEEIKMLEHFLALEQLRFRDKLQYEIVVSPNLNSELIEMPAMILQPYAENAIWHGIKPKTGPGLLKVSIKRNGKQLICIIEDDGIGREEAGRRQAASVLRKHKSQGMAITEERLKALGKVKGSKVEIVDLHDTEGNAVGTRVILRLPFKLLKNK